MSSAVHTYDDTHLRSIIHPTGPVLAAVLAIADARKLPGTAALLAQTLGVEISCRLGNALMLPPAQTNLSLFMTGITGSIGAAIAVSKVIDLDVEATSNAIGIAATQAAGLREMHGTMCSSFVSANAARGGAYAALLAERGFGSAARSLEGDKGWANVFSEGADLQAAMDGLGSEFELMFNAHKPYPCGVAIHPAIDACLDTLAEEGLSPSQIESCALTVHPVAIALTGRANPSSSLEAQVSLYHWAAAALVCGAAGLAEGSDRAVQDPEVKAMRKRIAVTSDPEMLPEQCRLVIGLKDGRQTSRHIIACRGTCDRPMTNAELDAKFLGQAETVFSSTQARALLAHCWDVSVVPDVGAISRAASLAA